MGFSRWISAAFAVALLTLNLDGQTARAQTDGEVDAGVAVVGDPETGKELARHCAECHGLEGMSETPAIPHLAGQHGSYLLNALNAYRTGQRTGEDMEAMAEVVASLDGEDMANVAAYYGSLELFTLAVEVGGRNAEAARKATEWDPLAAARAAAETCSACHGEDGTSEIPGTPGLAGQSRSYLLAAMTAYKEGARAHDEMQAFAEVISDSELELVARFYAASEPKRAEIPSSGDALAGRAPAAACASCHGSDGNSGDERTPRLAGLDASYLVDALEAYKEGTRSHAVMQDLAISLDGTDIQNLAAFYAAQEPIVPHLPKPLTIEQWAERCNRCHGAKGISTDPRFPILAGQSREYLIRALTSYHGGSRSSTMMFAMSFPMGEADIEHLADYYAGQTAK